MAVTVPSFCKRKKTGEKIAMLTAYDYPTAKILDEAKIDAILVGDSCANVVMGLENTLSITMDDMVHHTKMVTNAVERALVVADMPFLSYHISPEEAVRNAGRLIAEGGAKAVKLEGPAGRIGPAVKAILSACIPVMGHLGLTPQSLLEMGCYRVQGKTPDARAAIKKAAFELEELGCFAIVLECIPPDLAKEITEELSIPTIGIGAGADTDGQILVMHDILGWGETRFTKTYMDVRTLMGKAFANYISEVKGGTFPAEEHTYPAGKQAHAAAEQANPTAGYAFPAEDATEEPAYTAAEHAYTAEEHE